MVCTAAERDHVKIMQKINNSIFLLALSDEQVVSYKVATVAEM